MPTQLEELVEFLHSPQPAVVSIALDNLVGYSQGSHQSVFAYNNYESVTDLKKLAQESGKVTVSQSVTILANLCTDTKVRDLIVEDADFLKFLVGSIIRLTNMSTDLMCILLTNLAKNDHITKVFDFDLEHTPEQAKVFKSTKAMDCLMDCFVKGFDRTLNRYASFDYLAYFFADISRFTRGREYFITEQSYDEVVPISKLLVFTEKYDSKIRREGVASTIKNSLFDASKHAELVNNAKINLLPYILLPIAGPEEIDEDDMFDLPEELQLLPSDKKREPLKGLICIHLESLLLLCTTREMREYLRGKATYALVREVHKVHMEDDNIVDLCDRLVQMLMRDEANEDEQKVEEVDMEEDDSDDDAIVEVL
ncbi:Protein hgh1 [Yamadazyma tenuis]|uniref:DUF383-domain-containing protein n=1 Tax=Candida tenuis (strain ATCC 10573 / BCRC 21748 / CBS 615 / JCM 9827 / NBRC 10315 / NRRL Y-1498 / VKM Y-70) TaxID=590646 RepID=G3B6C6_CANTC|nr:DUF383-domain-containing protein [Yamadazyma tenuis ATCC 10573]XP_006687468.1 uncharacterized protein CANTEDRAFT_114741 [Yamadazyma tenuis ATCC 10573]EGV63674.1 DUF383-domain-containing protein [Yamadazyma tenuis ATCC 10573]EGV63675.1 hypothetical protein CANTEDRAFT_114741 [Yamadazyma tenuis ATCC 10573]WEJ96741.1 Protein hgh1 [Yamadazyma tenuis]